MYFLSTATKEQNGNLNPNTKFSFIHHFFLCSNNLYIPILSQLFSVSTKQYNAVLHVAPSVSLVPVQTVTVLADGNLWLPGFVTDALLWPSKWIYLDVHEVKHTHCSCQHIYTNTCLPLVLTWQKRWGSCGLDSHIDMNKYREDR